MALPPFFNESLTAEERDAVRDQLGLEAYSDRMLSFPTEGAVLQGYEQFDDPQLKQQALDRAKRDFPSTNAVPRETFKKAYDFYLNDLRAKKPKQVQGRQRAISEAGQAGVAESPMSVLPTEEQHSAIQNDRLWQKTRMQVLADLWREGNIPQEQASRLATLQAGDEALEAEIAKRMEFKMRGPPGKNGESLLGKVTWGLGLPARAVGGALGGALTSVAEQSSSPGLDEVQPEKKLGLADVLFNPRLSPTGLLYKSLTGGNLDEIGASGRVLGVKPNEAAQALTNSATWKGAAKGLVEAAMGPDSSEFTLDAALSAQHDKYKQVALEQTKKEFAGQNAVPREQFQARYEEHLGRLVGQDVGGVALANPNAARFASEMVLDPLNAVPIGAASKVARKGVGAALDAVGPKGKTLLDQVRYMFKYAPEYERLPESMADAGSLGRLAADQAGVSVDEALGQMEAPLGQMRKVKAADRATLFDLLEQKASLESRETLYHGGPVQLDTFDPTQLQKNDYGYYGPGFYLTNDSTTAGRYARMSEGGGKISLFSHVPEAQIFEGTTKASPELWREIAGWLGAQGDTLIEAARDSRPASEWAYAAVMGQIPPSSGPALQNAYARAKGYAGIRFRDVEGSASGKPADAVVVFDPKGLRAGKALDVPEHLREAYKAGLELSEQHRALREQTGVGQDWDKEGVLQKPRLLDENEGYVPHRVKDKAKGADFEDVLPEGTSAPTMDTVLPASTKARAGGKVKWTKDPVAQWEAELLAIKPKAKVAQEMKNMRAFFEGEQGALYSSTLKYTPEESAKHVELLKKQTGVDWVELPQNLEERFQRLTGTPGAVAKGGTSTFVPRPIAERLTSLVKIVDEDKAMGALEKFNEAFNRPRRIWRTMVTLPMPAFHVTNAVGSVGLGYVAHGLKAFDPTLQAGAAAGALSLAIGGKGKAGAKAIPYALKSGKQFPLADILKAAEEDGIVNLFDARQGYEMQTRGKSVVGKALDAANSVVDLATKATGARALAKGIDDYQHLVVYLGALEDLTPVARAKAADFTAKFAGNYKRLGEGERKYLKDAFGFYSWTRFIFPHIANQMLENPSRLATFAKLRGYTERETGKNAPVFSGGVPNYLQGKGVTAPLAKQPEALQITSKNKERPALDSHEFAMMTLEDPLNMGFAWLPMIENTLKGKRGDDKAETVVNMLDPFSQAAIELMTGIDVRTGEQIAGAGEHLGNFGYKFVERPSEAFKNLIKLYAGTPTAADLAMRYKAGRDFMGLEKPFVDEIRSIPSYPGGKLFPIDPNETFERKQKNALELLKQRTYQKTK